MSHPDDTPEDRLPQVLLRREGAIGWIVFDNPRRHNAMSLAMWEALPACIDALEADPAVRVVALRGAGEQAFVSGADISEFERERDTVEAHERYEAIGSAAMGRLAQCGKPTIAMLRGWCLGGGMAIALNCDMRIADESLRFGIPAARLGIGYRWPGIQRLVETVGAPNARQILLTGRSFHAHDALRMGFVNQVAPAGGVESAVRAECEVIAANAPLTMASAKTSIDEIMRAGPHLDVGRMDDATRRAFASEDFAEGRRAFMEKRRPRFQGK